MDSVTIDEFLQFLCVRSHAVVFFLIGDVLHYQVHIGMRHREGAIPSAPCKFPVTNSFELTHWEELPFKSCTTFSIDKPVGMSISACTWSGFTKLIFMYTPCSSAYSNRYCERPAAAFLFRTRSRFNVPQVR